MDNMKNKKINILHWVDVENELGETDHELQYLAQNVWAYYRHATTRETQLAIVAQTKVEAIFIINWRDDIDTTCFIEYNDEKYEITDIDDFEGRKTDLKITAHVDKEG
ncbi:phage head closure protein [Clostridium sp. HV4-5-A1G]|uniref:phage head closure protein n=1 Tax=Clostridium sp. HV4-5-A1G TaxID=2004595 RepID=UPI00123BC04A|nr:phage head closure protein [Clostridium sp. HV4-5-A1G]KAA8674456.1 phage head closure protein [Clostridium sp. HV4-5-A1G]